MAKQWHPLLNGSRCITICVLVYACCLLLFSIPTHIANISYVFTEERETHIFHSVACSCIDDEVEGHTLPTWLAIVYVLWLPSSLLLAVCINLLLREPHRYITHVFLCLYSSYTVALCLQFSLPMMVKGCYQHTIFVIPYCILCLLFLYVSLSKKTRTIFNQTGYSYRIN